MPMTNRFKTVAICDECWKKEHGEREPFRLKKPVEEHCYACKQPTKSGIYVRRRLDEIRAGKT